jgi:CRP-like cAMP-binding protein
MSDHAFPAGTVIFRTGDPGEQAYLIREGTVELLLGPLDQATRLAQLGPGEVFGEMSLIEERPHSLSARAISATRATALTRDEFEQLLTADPGLFRLYLKALFERLRSLSGQAEETPVEPSASRALVPRTLAVTIHPLTHRAAETLPDDGLLIPKFPFRIGRAPEAREGQPLSLNDLWLLDRMPFNISRSHARIDTVGDNVVIKDHGSSLGMYVNEVHIGGQTQRRQLVLEDGDNVVVLGKRNSPYHFRIHVARG